MTDKCPTVSEIIVRLQGDRPGHLRDAPSLAQITHLSLMSWNSTKASGFTFGSAGRNDQRACDRAYGNSIRLMVLRDDETPPTCAACRVLWDGVLEER